MRRLSLETARKMENRSSICLYSGTHLNNSGNPVRGPCVHISLTTFLLHSELNMLPQSSAKE